MYTRIYAESSNFNPLRPRGRRPLDSKISDNSILISTHSAREDGDKLNNGKSLTNTISTHSAREDGDEMLQKFCDIWDISTHSAREDGDPYYLFY